jgi:hypothetical protein
MPNWKYCYNEPLTDNFHVHFAGSKLVENRVIFTLNMTLKDPIDSGRFQFEIWHSETGDKIQYKGPYDICCGFKTNTTCLQDKIQECPLKGNIHATISKPLHKNHTGMYESTLIIFNSSNEEILCIDAPFLNKIENKEKIVISLKKENDSNTQGKEIIITENKN